MTGDVMGRSNIPEVAASKNIGGALLGVWSMLMHYGGDKNGVKIYIYSIDETPDKDLSHIRYGDFEYLKEVRYKKAVKGNYIGYFIIDKKFNEYAENFYNRINGDPWDEFTDEEIDMYDEFEKFLEDININDLN